MKINLRKALLLLNIICLCVIFIGIVLADEDQSNQDWTTEAYPGAPTPVPTSSPAPLSQTSAGINPIPIVPYSPSQVQPTNVVQLGQSKSSVAVSTSTAAQYSQTALYSTQAPPASQQNVLVSYNVQTTAPPTAVYYGGAFMPWNVFYQSFPKNAPALWVASSAGWSWYATCPQGGWIQNLMYVPFTGTMKLYEFYPDGTTKLYNYGFQTPGYKYIWFYADTPGRHISLFTIFDRPSNYIAIDVY